MADQNGFAEVVDETMEVRGILGGDIGEVIEGAGIADRNVAEVLEGEVLRNPRGRFGFDSILQHAATDRS